MSRGIWGHHNLERGGAPGTYLVERLEVLLSDPAPDMGNF